jgi:type I restriction enzyme M protein
MMKVGKNEAMMITLAKKKSISSLTKLKESATRKKIDAILVNLGWNTDESSPQCNVFTERCKKTSQHKLLLGAEPDYVLYQSGTDIPIGIIETKKPGEDLEKALSQAKNSYASPLGVHIVFVSDGSLTDAYDLRDNKNLRIDGETVTELLTEKSLLRFVEEGSRVFTPDKYKISRRELISAFAEANDLLRKEGLREGIERFTEFSNLLFLKLISELENDREKNNEPRILEKKYCWEQFNKKDAESMLDYINDTILPRLIGKYNHSGDVFQPKLLINKPEILKKIVDRLSTLQLLNADSDIKGDAFEYFLKNSITVGNDLGEYFTPRHIVKLIVDLVAPKYGETVYDPCCGTGGFLIAAFKHLKRNVKITKESLKILREDTIFGREFTGTAKIAKMNMILTGDGHNNIKQMDSLEKPIKGKYNVVLTNFPFSQQTDYAGYYGLKGTDANPVFLAHVMNAMNKENGRAGVVVPEGMLFKEDSQYANIRKRLVDQFNVTAIIKLHSFVFRPYTGQPTSIIFFEKGEQTKNVWFFEVTEDGYEKTSSKTGRETIELDDLTLLRTLWADKAASAKSFTVNVDSIRKNKYKLSMDSYRKQQSHEGWVDLGGEKGICDILIGGTPSTKNHRYWRGGTLPWVTITDMTQQFITATKRMITPIGAAESSVKLLPKDTVLLSFKLTIGKVVISGVPLYTNEAVAGLIPKKPGTVLPKYLYHLLSRMDLTSNVQDAAKGKTLNLGSLKSIRIPLPDLDTQSAIVEQMDAYQAEQFELQEKIDDLQRTANELIAQYLKPNSQN